MDRVPRAISRLGPTFLAIGTALLLTIQFPFADSRKYLVTETGMLGLPNWPATRRDVDFVRSFGIVRKRGLGGLSSWVGENQVCEAARALRFPNLPTFVDPKSELRVPFQLAFRRFFFDGQAVGKFEVGLATEPADSENLSRQQTEGLLDHFLNIPVDIPNPFPPTDKTSSPALSLASKRLSRLYLFSSTKFSLAKDSTWWSTTKPNWWVSGGAPIVFLVHQESEAIEIPGKGQLLPSLDNRLGFNLSYSEITRKGKSIPLWVLSLTSGTNYKAARSLRINLLRLHAEHEALKLILQNIRTKKIPIVTKVDDPTHPSNLLQKYLGHATDRILSLESESNDISDDKLAVIASQSEDIIEPGERQSLLQAISDIRPTVVRKVEQYFDQRTYNHQEVNNLGDEYNITGGVVGAVGKYAKNYGDLYNQWSKSGTDMNLENLAKELAKLQAELVKQRAAPGDDATTDAVKEAAAHAVKEAATAALNSDGQTAFSYLAKAGHWAFEVAKTAAVPVALAALKTALGFGP